MLLLFLFLKIPSSVVRLSHHQLSQRLHIEIPSGQTALWSGVLWIVETPVLFVRDVTQLEDAVDYDDISGNASDDE